MERYCVSCKKSTVKSGQSLCNSCIPSRCSRSTSHMYLSELFFNEIAFN